jgi:hypothetical protein
MDLIIHIENNDEYTHVYYDMLYDKLKFFDGIKSSETFKDFNISKDFENIINHNYEQILQDCYWCVTNPTGEYVDKLLNLKFEFDYDDYVQTLKDWNVYEIEYKTLLENYLPHELFMQDIVHPDDIYMNYQTLCDSNDDG